MLYYKSMVADYIRALCGVVIKGLKYLCKLFYACFCSASIARKVMCDATVANQMFGAFVATQRHGSSKGPSTRLCVLFHFACNPTCFLHDVNKLLSCFAGVPRMPADRNNMRCTTSTALRTRKRLPSVSALWKINI